MNPDYEDKDYKWNKNRIVSANNFMGTIAYNVDNKKLSDSEFREFIRNTLPIVRYPNPKGN